MLQNSQRIEFVDLAKGICIIMVVFGHSLGPWGEPDFLLKNTLAIFRMPLYFFLSGLFFKTYGGLFNLVKKKLNKLLIPYLFWHIVFVCSVPLFSRTTTFDYHLFFDFIMPGGESHNRALWFLLCLFVQNIVFFGILKLFDRYSCKKELISGSVLLLGICGYALSLYHYRLPLKFETVLTAFPFFALGLRAKDFTSILVDEKYNKWCLPLSIICFFVTYSLSNGLALYYKNSYDGLSLIELYLGGFFGILFIVMLSKYLQHLPLVSYLGRYSIIILVTHLPIVWYISFYLSKSTMPWGASSILSTLITLFLYSFIIPIFRKWLPYVTAQKDLIK